jgi:8-amino-7-oxononanoate synthase
MSFRDHVRSALIAHAEAGLMRSPRAVTGPQGPMIRVDGKLAVCLCSNNYLGLASHPAIAQAAIDSLRELGFGAAASRHISGSMDLHRAAEVRLASFVALPEALLFSSGYAANVGAIQALASVPGTQLFSDELNHASLIDGCRLSRAEVHVYRHADPEHLTQLLRAERKPRVAGLILTESVFSMDGDLAPLPELRDLARQFDCGLVVDEAHALGVLGPHGRGHSAASGVIPDVLIGTLGKAFGTAGAFVAGDSETIRWVANRARSYIFSTAPSPSLAAAALAATELVEAADPARAQLQAHAARLRSELQALEFHVQAGQTPILPVIVGASDATMALSARLLEHGVFVHGIRPPTVAPGTSRLRVTAMATHTEAQLETAIAAFRAVAPGARPAP